MENDSFTPRVAVIGTGAFGSLHVGVLANLRECQLVAICEPNEAASLALADKYQVPRTYSDVGVMLENEQLDAVFITVPEHLHFEIATQFIDRRIHCFVEKPLATNAAEARRLIDHASTMQVILQVGHILRFEAQHAILHDSVSAGSFGQLMTIRAKRNPPAAMWETSGNSVHIAVANLVHDIDQILWMAGGQRASSVRAYQRNFTGHKFPDCVVATIELSGGTLAMVEASWSVPTGAPANIVSENWSGRFDASLEVVGVQGTGQVRVYESGIEMWTNEGAFAPNSALWPEVHGAIGGALRDELAHFLALVGGKTNKKIVSLEDAVHGLEILESIIESATAGEEVKL